MSGTSHHRPLRGSCQCGRNIYVIQPPQDANGLDLARVLFHSSPAHSTLLPAHLRIPLAWYRAAVHPFQADETNSQIHRVYHSPGSPSTMRHFCGFCGTPLSFWSENPQSEKDYIQLTLGSLFPEDLGDLEELGLLGSSGSASGEASEEEDGEGGSKEVKEAVHGRMGVVPWLDSLLEGSRLGNMRRMKRGAELAMGGGKRVKVEWEVVEWDEEEDQGEEVEKEEKEDEEKEEKQEEDNKKGGVRVGKRKLEEVLGDGDVM